MVSLEGWVFSIFIAIVMIESLKVGMLITELFNNNRKSKFEVAWLLVAAFLWICFLGFVEYGIFTGEDSAYLWIISSVLLFIAIIIFLFIAIRTFNLLNKILFFSTGISITATLIISMISIYHPLQELLLPMTFIIFMVSLLGVLSFIDILIKNSKGYKMKVEEKSTWNKKFTLIGIILGLIVSGIFVASIFYGEEYVAPELSGELNVYNWIGYFDEDNTILDAFEEEFGIEVNSYTYESEAEAMEEIENYQGVYDVVVAIDSNFEIEIADDKLEKLNLRNIPNVKNIDTKFKIANNYDYEYGIPYIWGTTGIVINTKYVPEDTNSWDVLWNTEYDGKIGILFNEEELFGLGARYVGTPLVPSKISDLTKISDFLKLQKELVGGYKSSYEIIDGMIDESIWVAVTWNVDAAIMSYDNPNIKYIIPKEGTIMWIEHMVIPKGASNKENAEAFINFIHRPEIYARIANYQGSPGVNIPAREFIDEEIMNDETLNIPKEDFDKLEDYYSFNPSEDILKLRHEIWEELIT